VLEYAQRVAQLRVGNLYSGAAVRQEDVIPTKMDEPRLSMFQNLTGGVAPGSVVGFGWPEHEENKAFKDERVRQALSMSYDRDLYIDTFFNISNFKTAGLPADIRWNSSMGPVSPWHLDPRSKDFGPNAKYYEYNVAEAKKLLAAAGYPNGLEILSNYQPNDSQQVQVLEDMSRAVGFRPHTNLIDYDTQYGPRFRDGRGKFEGWAYISSSTAEDAVTYFHWRFHSTGQTFLGYDVNGRGDGSGDPFVDSTIEKARTEFDTQRRMALVHELQRYLAQKQYCVVNPGRSEGFSLAWPAVGNYNVYIGDHHGDNYNWWLDETRAPVTRA
jgi:ABC-type transport system substrate-binding protein